jgi:hypothetical protein
MRGLAGGAIAIAEVERAAGWVRRGEFSPAFPFAQVGDPDGYEIEIRLSGITDKMGPNRCRLSVLVDQWSTPPPT